MPTRFMFYNVAPAPSGATGRYTLKRIWSTSPSWTM
jgi:hypothetical protein